MPFPLAIGVLAYVPGMMTPTREMCMLRRMTHKLHLVGWTAALLLIGGVARWPAEAAVTTLYVDGDNPSCSNSGSGTATQPYCTIGAGVSHAVAGHTVQVAAGSYAEMVTMPRSGTSTQPITVTAAPGATVTLSGGVNGFKVSSKAYIVISGFTVTGTSGPSFNLGASNHLTIQNDTASNAGQPVSGATARGIYLSGVTDSVISGNTVHNVTDSGIYVNGTSGNITVSGNTTYLNARGYERAAAGIDVRGPSVSVIGNVSHDNEDSGIQFYTGASSVLAADNVTYNNGDHGIDDLNVAGGTIVGNTVYHNCTTGINVEGTSGNYVIKNNIAVDNAVYPAYNGISCKRRAGNIGVWDSAPSTTMADRNIVYLTKSGVIYAWGTTFSSLTAMRAASGQEGQGLQVDPGFAAPASWDLTLLAGSPAIDSADSGVAGSQSVDASGAARVDDPATPNSGVGPRSYDDRGAQEYQP